MRENGTANGTGSRAPRLLEEVRHRIRLKHYSLSAEYSYVDWIKRFIPLHRKGSH
jgi:hypothetical protein